MSGQVQKLFWLLVFVTIVGCLLVIVVFQFDSEFARHYFPLKKFKTEEIVYTSYYVNRTGNHCDLHFDWGVMCPKLYTELGGRCHLINGTFDCPDIRKKANSTQRQSQLVLIRMLRIFDLLAQKHNIFYWIAHGTLLGAVRHQGFIPWDHDIDIHIPLEDYIKFFQVAAKELPDDIFFQNCISDPELLPSDRVIAEKAFHIHSIVGIYQRFSNPRLRDRRSCYRFCFINNCKWHDGLMIDIFVFPLESRWVYPLKQMAFEGFLFPVPNNWWWQLKSEYGISCFQLPTDIKLDDESMDPLHSCEELASKT